MSVYHKTWDYADPAEKMLMDDAFPKIGRHQPLSVYRDDQMGSLRESQAKFSRAGAQMWSSRAGGNLSKIHTTK